MDLLARLGLQVPIIQAPMAGVQTSALALAVDRAGGLGSLPCAMLTPEALCQELRHLSQEARCYNLNFFCHTSPQPDAKAEMRWRQCLAPYYAEYAINPDKIPAGPGRAPFSREIADLIEPFQPPVLSFHFGLPEPHLLQRVKNWGTYVMSSATTVEEARWLVAHGADAVIAQGWEAGGHRGMFLSDDLNEQLSTLALLPQIVDAVEVPVIAAGGIATPAGVRAALALGAAAVQIGTAYLLTDQATTSPLHRQALKHGQQSATALTNLFTGRPARGLVNRLMAELGPLNRQTPRFPLATAALAPLRAAAEMHGDSSFTPLWCGQNRSGCLEIDAGRLTRILAGLE